jgi:hypothetical protein
VLVYTMLSGEYDSGFKAYFTPYSVRLNERYCDRCDRSLIRPAMPSGEHTWPEAAPTWLARRWNCTFVVFQGEGACNRTWGGELYHHAWCKVGCKQVCLGHRHLAGRQQRLTS